MRAPVESASRTPVLDREQLVTLRIDGRRVLVLVDASASMLDETLVNVIRLRNMPPERRIASAKWQQAVNTVEWIAARLPRATQFQVYAFDTAPRPLVEGSAGRWLDARMTPARSRRRCRRCASTAPTGGSSLQNAFAVISQLDPAPDNVILVTDGLPTQGDKPPLMRTLVTMEQREDLMQEAVKSLPPSPPPFNIVLLPMEGDPAAPIYFWRLARATGGALPEPGEGLAMKRRTRRDTETFSMSFLDCICCGFGAIILLLVLNEFGEPIQLEQSQVDLEGQIVRMEAEAVRHPRHGGRARARAARAHRGADRGAAAALAPARRPVHGRGQAQGQHRGGGGAQEAEVER